MITTYHEGELWTEYSMDWDYHANTGLFDTSYAKTRSEFIIFQSDLSKAGFIGGDVITEMSFMPIGPVLDLVNVTIGLKHTTEQAPTSFDLWETFKNVYHNPIISSAIIKDSQWLTFNITPFIWNGEDHMRVALFRDDESFGTLGKWQSRDTEGKNTYIGYKTNLGPRFPFDEANFDYETFIMPALKFKATRYIKETWERPELEIVQFERR